MDPEVEASKLLSAVVLSLTGRARELYERSPAARAIIENVLTDAMKLVAELATSQDPERRRSIMMSLEGAEDTLKNEIAAIAQGAVTESAGILQEVLLTVARFAREAAPIMIEWARRGS